MTSRLSAALYYTRKTLAALLALVAFLLIGAGIAVFASAAPELWATAHVLAIIVGIGLLPAAVALWTDPKHANLLGFPLIVLPLSFPTASSVGHFLYDNYPDPGVIFADWLRGPGILWLVPIAVGVGLLPCPLRTLWRRFATAGTEDLRRWLRPIGLLILGGFAFQGLLSLVAPALDSPAGQRASYATVVIGDRSIEVVLGITPEQSAAKARQLCPSCEFVGPEPGRCVG